MKSGMLARMFGTWANYFSDGASRRQGLPSAPASGGTRLSPDNFSSQMRSFRKRNKEAAEALVAGSVQLLGFEEIKKRFGDRWTDIKAKAYLIAESVIQAEIGPEDLFVRIDEERYIILFGKMSKQRAEIRARQLAIAISNKLCGALEGGAIISVRGLAVKLDRSLNVDRIDSLELLAIALQQGQEAAERREEKTLEKLKIEMSVTYWPTLNLRKGLVTAYEAALKHRPAPGQTVIGESAIPRGASGYLVCALDCLLLEATGTALIDLGEHQHKASLICPVHYETLAVKDYRDKYWDICRQLPACSDRHLMLHILDMPTSVPQVRLHEVLVACKPFFLSFICRLPATFTGLNKYTGAGLIGLSCLEADEAVLRSFTEAAAKLKFHTWFAEATTSGSAAIATHAGFEYLSGPALLPPGGPWSGLFVEIRQGCDLEPNSKSSHYTSMSYRHSREGGSPCS